MAETPRQVIRRRDGQSYSPGTLTETVYVLKSTDQWLPDEGPDGAIWSGTRGRIKGNQHTARYILDADGVVLRPPLPGGEGQSVLAGPTRSMTRRRAERRTQRRDQLVSCARAVTALAEHREEIGFRRVHDMEHDQEIHAVLAAIVRRWTRLTPTKFITPVAKRRRAKVPHREHVVPVRVLVDRMIKDPSECQDLLEKAVIIANVTPEEHSRLHRVRLPDLRDRMLEAPVLELESLGRERYKAAKIDLQPFDAARRRRRRGRVRRRVTLSEHPVL